MLSDCFIIMRTKQACDGPSLRCHHLGVLFRAQTTRIRVERVFQTATGDCTFSCPTLALGVFGHDHGILANAVGRCLPYCTYHAPHTASLVHTEQKKPIYLMTTAALSAGCALLAFSPTLCLLFHLTYSKANLIIIVTTSAFAYLLSTVVSSLLWLPVPSSLRDNPYLLIFPSIVAQFVTRAGFVWLYHKVEHSVERSVRRHQAAEERVRAEAAAARRRRRRSTEDVAANSNNGGGSGGGAADNDNENDDDEPPASESAKLRLELNDWSSSLAAGTGYGGMHVIFLYGTLLASEANNVGTLYQPSCDVMPSLVNSALVSHLFSLLDMVWMMWTFYGMRRRRDGGTFESEGGLLPAPGTSGHGGTMRNNSTVSFSGDIDIAGGASGSGGSSGGAVYHLANNKRGGNGALILVLVSHCAAALSTVPNAYDNGCLVALPCLAGVALVTGLVFWLSCAGHYLPNAQRRRQYERTASMAAEAAAAGARPGRYED